MNPKVDTMQPINYISFDDIMKTTNSHTLTNELKLSLEGTVWIFNGFP